MRTQALSGFEAQGLHRLAEGLPLRPEPGPRVVGLKGQVSAGRANRPLSATFERRQDDLHDAPASPRLVQGESETLAVRVVQWPAYQHAHIRPLAYRRGVILAAGLGTLARHAAVRAEVLASFGAVVVAGSAESDTPPAGLMRCVSLYSIWRR